MSFASIAVIKMERNRNFANHDTYFLVNWFRSGLYSRTGFIVAGALRGLLRVVS